MSKIIIKISAETFENEDSLKPKIENVLANQGLIINSVSIETRPSIGDFGIFWDDDDEHAAVISVLSSIDSNEDGSYPYQIENGTWYSRFTPFVSEEHYRNFLKGNV